MVFNPRLREGGDHQKSAGHLNRSVFNPRLREGGDYHDFPAVEQKEFSIHASAKEATCNRKHFAGIRWFSIHASAKEATENATEVEKGIKFSIHASAKEATTALLAEAFKREVFNPRLREGGDSLL